MGSIVSELCGTIDMSIKENFERLNQEKVIKKYVYIVDYRFKKRLLEDDDNTKKVAKNKLGGKLSKVPVLQDIVTSSIVCRRANSESPLLKQSLNTSIGSVLDDWE